MFVAAGTSVTTVMIPKGWSATGLAAPAGATFVRASNPGDSNQQVVEDIKSTAWDLQGFFSRLPSGAGQYLVPGQVVRYTIVNPNNPYPDEGIIANTSSGSIRVDVYLPKAERATADAILQSFIPQK